MKNLLAPNSKLSGAKSSNSPRGSNDGKRSSLIVPDEAYAKVATAIDYLVTHGEDQPTLEETAHHVGLSPHYFQRVFKAGAGVSPKRFLQYLSLGRARDALREGQSVLEASFAAGLSGPSRLHDLVIVADAMTPGCLRKKGAGECIRYGAFPSPFGEALIGATDKGICWLSFERGAARSGFDEMCEDWPGATFENDLDFIKPLAEQAFAFARGDKNPKRQRGGKRAALGLHLSGTNFQLKVWEALLKIPYGGLVTYGDLARFIDKPKASRAVGTAVGANSISLLIPCHRVILSSGAVHNYRWGAGRKKAILALEAANIEAPLGEDSL